MRIRAAVTDGGPFTIQDVDLDDPRPDEVLVRIAAAGICHTDLTMRARWPATRSPMIFGHEGAGVVEAVGDAVTSVRPGDTVVLSYRSCGACEECAAGQPAYCVASGLNMAGTRADGTTTHSRVFGSFFGQSSFATHALAHVSCVVPIPADFPAVLAAPLGCGVQTGAGTVLEVLRPAPGETLVVFGAGSVGLSAVMAARAEGCEVFAVDPVAARRKLAEQFGATALTPEETTRGAHHAIDTTGKAPVITQAIRSLRRRGTLALVGIGGAAEFDIMTVLSNGIRIRGVVEGDVTPARFVPRLIDLHRRGRLPIEALITEFPFDAIEDAARAAAEGRVIKPVLTFS